jgi:hypothetical protein
MRAPPGAPPERAMLVVPCPDAAPADRGHLARWPIVQTVARRTFPRLVEASLIPAVLLYLVVAFGGFELGMLAVLAWTYGAVAHRRLRGMPVPALLVLATVGVTVRTIVALCSGSALVYFLQPIGTTIAVAVLFLASVAIGRPVVGWLAADFFPFTPEVARLPAVIRLFRGLTVLWSVVQLLKAATTLALLQTMSMGNFVALRTLATLLLTVGGIALTITWSLRIARREGLAFALA